VKQAAYRLVFRKLVVELRSLRRGEDVRFDLPFLQKLKAFGTELETFRHPSREHHDPGTVI
jgi:hypothetical protein